MYSQLFCGSLDTSAPVSNFEKDDDFLIKIYKIELSKYQELVSWSASVLSDFERDRAERFHFIKDKNTFIICRMLLKCLLAEHIDLHIDDIIIDVDSNKKPYLGSHPSVFFNLTHSGDYAMIAIANTPIGVDVEFIKKGFQYEEVLPITFHALEIDTIRGSKDKNRAFYQFWTRKEAVVKALGTGIDDDLPNIIVTDGLHDVPLDLLGDFKKMSVYSFTVGDGYIGALASTDGLFDVENVIFVSLPTPDKLKSLIF